MFVIISIEFDGGCCTAAAANVCTLESEAQGAPSTADRDPVGSIPLRRENQTAGGSRL